MAYGELNYESVTTGINPITGKFMKGHIPYNKGKKWNEYMPKKSQRGSRKGWKNLKKYPPTHFENSGRPKKSCVAVTDDGRFQVFESLKLAGRMLGKLDENIRRCCKWNRDGTQNTDHKYMGLRWYFESDNKWMSKIKK